MKNRLTDLNDHLFAQLERLSDENLSGEDLAQEINRAKAVQGIASAAIDNARLVFDAHKAMADGLTRKLPLLLEAKD